MSAASPIAICNRSLTLVGGNTITSFLDGTREAKLCSLHYASVRDAVTEAYNWSHARARAGPLVPDATPPAFGYSFRYLLDVGMLTLQWAGTDPEGVHQLPRYEVEGGYLLCNEGAGVRIRYLQRVEDTTRFTHLFTESLVARLAAELAIPLAESKALAAQQFKLYQGKVDEAAAVDGQQGRNTPTTAVRHQIARWGGGRGTPGFWRAGG